MPICDACHKSVGTKENVTDITDIAERAADLHCLIELKESLKKQVEHLQKRETIDGRAQLRDALLRTNAILTACHEEEESTHLRANANQIELAEQNVLLQDELNHLKMLTDAVAQRKLQISLQNMVRHRISEHLSKTHATLEGARWRAALQIFLMIPIEPSFPSDVSTTKSTSNLPKTSPSTQSKMGRRSVQLNGVSTICGLPLLNSGDIDRDTLTTRSEVISAALAQVAHLAQCVAAILNIEAPHPLRLFDSHDCFISPGGDRKTWLPLTPLFLPLRTPNKTFPLALSLLRANIVALCLRAGMRPSTLYPPQALLLNLSLLHSYCLEQSKKIPYSPEAAAVSSLPQLWSSSSRQTSATQTLPVDHPLYSQLQLAKLQMRHTPKEGEIHSWEFVQ